MKHNSYTVEILYVKCISIFGRCSDGDDESFGRGTKSLLKLRKVVGFVCLRYNMPQRLDTFRHEADNAVAPGESPSTSNTPR